MHRVFTTVLMQHCCSLTRASRRSRFAPTTRSASPASESAGWAPEASPARAAYVEVSLKLYDMTPAHPRSKSTQSSAWDLIEKGRSG